MRRKHLLRSPEAYHANSQPGAPLPARASASSFRSTLSDALCMPPLERGSISNPASTPTPISKRNASPSHQGERPASVSDALTSEASPVGRGLLFDASNRAPSEEMIDIQAVSGRSRVGQRPSPPPPPPPSSGRGPAGGHEGMYSLSLAGHEAFQQSPARPGSIDSAWGAPEHSTSWTAESLFSAQLMVDALPDGRHRLQTSTAVSSSGSSATRPSSNWDSAGATATFPTSQAASALWDQSFSAAAAFLTQDPTPLHQFDGNGRGGQTLQHRPTSATAETPVAQGVKSYSQSGRSLPAEAISFGSFSDQMAAPLQDHHRRGASFVAGGDENMQRSQPISLNSPDLWSSIQLPPTFTADMSERDSLGTAVGYRTPSQCSQALNGSSVGSYKSNLHQASPTFHRGSVTVTPRPLDASPQKDSNSPDSAGPSDGGQAQITQALMPSFGSLGSATMFAARPLPLSQQTAGRLAAKALTPISSSGRRPISASSLLAATAKVSLQSPQTGLTSLDAGKSVPSRARPGAFASSYSWTGDPPTFELQASSTSPSQISEVVIPPRYVEGDAFARELGLGLDLMPDEKDHEMIEHLAPELPPSAAYDEDVAMQVDEMGRLTFAATAPQQQRRDSTTSVSTGYTGSHGFDSASSRPRHGIWHQSASSWLTTGDGSWLASTGPSSVDNSFQDDSIGSAAGKARSRTSLQHQPSSTASASMWLPGSRPTSSSSVAAAAALGADVSLGRSNSDVRRSEATFQSRLGDFSEFGQSVPIESMAEERWRTWPRERGPSDHQRSSGSAVVAQSPPDAATTAGDGSGPLAVSTVATSSTTIATPGRARLTVEPYSKSQRSARPSSGGGGERPALMSVLPSAEAASTSQPPVTSSSSSSSTKVGFNEVSAALDTLSAFLRQKSSSSNRPPFGGSSQAGSSTPSEEHSQSSESCSTSLPRRTLRRTKGILPPRGSVLVTESAIDSGQGKQSSSAPGHGHGHGRGLSLGAVATSSSSVKSSREQDRMAVLQDLSERVRRLKEASESGRHGGTSGSSRADTTASQSTAGPAHQRSRSSFNVPSRRAMHEEFLAARAHPK